ncbi:guanylate kinase [Patescibacteria group bacterium]|nr:guanylate kinase [Patescibacteria group bacterium]
MKGKFVLVVGTSGSGKNTLIEHVRPLFPEVVYAKSCVTRAPREGEDSGYRYFVSKEDFEGRVNNGEFLEWAEYGGNLYGTLKAEVVVQVEAGKIVLKELEVQGVRQIREKMPKEDLVIVFINAGSWEDVEARIKARSPMSTEELLKRRAHYDDEMSYMKEADIVIQNKQGEVEQAKKDFENAIRTLVEAIR